MAVAAAVGRWVKFVLKPGPAAAAPELPALIPGLAARELSADQAYATDIARSPLAAAGIAPVIPYRARRRPPAWYDPGMYRLRRLVESRFAAVKEYRGIATRYCKLAEPYAAALSLTAVVASKEKESGRNPGAGRRSIGDGRFKVGQQGAWNNSGIMQPEMSVRRRQDCHWILQSSLMRGDVPAAGRQSCLAENNGRLHSRRAISATPAAAITGKAPQYALSSGQRHRAAPNTRLLPAQRYTSGLPRRDWTAS